MAASIKALGTTKVMLTVWHEPESAVSPGGDPNCPNVAYKGTAGTVAQYVNMWSYVENRFATDGVTNVVWAMDYMNYAPWQCLINDLYPGDNLVDWILFNAYGDNNPNFDSDVDQFYNFLTANSDAAHDYLSKPWGIAEWGIQGYSTAQEEEYYAEAKTALDDNTFPNLKAYTVYDGENLTSGLNYRVAYDDNGTYDPTKASYYYAFADDPRFTDAYYNRASTSTSTTADDAGTGGSWTGTETTGSTADDTSIVSGEEGGIVPTGTVTYSFFTNGTCTGVASTTSSAALNADGTVPSSPATVPLAAGTYGFEAAYSGDDNYTGSTSSCGPFRVATAPTSSATTVDDAAGSTPWAGTESTGSSADGTSVVSGEQAGIVPTGTVTYSFFTNGTCGGAASTTNSVTLNADGTVPSSAPTAPLAAGPYGFEAVYSGDANYSSSTGSCSGFSVAAAGTSTATTVDDAAGSTPWAGTESTGSSAYGTSVVSGEQAGIVPTGTVTYSFFTNGSCTDPVSTTDTVTLAGGAVPNSAPTAALTAGTYGFEAAYSGDANYSSSTSSCSSFGVGVAASSTTVAVDDSTTGNPWAGNEATGSEAYGTSVVSGQQGGIVASGAVTYNFFTGSCSGTLVSNQTMTLSADGTVPNSAPTAPLTAGSYGFEAVYSGDANYSGSTSGCGQFTVGTAATSTAATVYDATAGSSWAGTETTGSTADGTSVVSGEEGAIVSSGTVTYSFFTNVTCTGTPSTADTVTLNPDGTVPGSAPTAPLAAGPYGFEAVYSGDANYSGSSSGCENFSVAKAASTTTAAVDDATTGNPWAGTETTGSAAEGSSMVSGEQGGIAASGAVTYNFFTGSCSGSLVSNQTVTLAGNGTVPSSGPTAPLTAGLYGFEAVYSGDTNYSGSTSGCATVSVAKAASSTAMTVYDATTNQPWAGTETTGSTAYDTSVVSEQGGIAPSGTVTYSLFTNKACTGTASTTGSVTLAGGAAPNSGTTAALSAGSYSFRAKYSGDSNYGTSTSSCGVLSVAKAPSSTATTAYDATTKQPWAGTETTGATAYDSSVVSGQGGIVPSGTVTYSRFTNGTCTGTASSTNSVTLVGGAVPSSSTTAVLTAGIYAFEAAYSGDANYSGSTSGCAALTVAKAGGSTAATVYDAATKQPWAGTEATGSKAYGTSVVSGEEAGIVPSGSVTYNFFNVSCSGSLVSNQTVTLAAKAAVPNSATIAALAAGPYAFDAVYSGDANYSSSTSSCETFRVATAGSLSATTVYDATTKKAWAGSEATGSTAYDTSVVSGEKGGILPSGSVIYNFFSNATCTGTASTTGSVTLANGTVPHSATTAPLAVGTYGFEAVYSGDANYSGSTSSCGHFSVAKAASTTAATAYDATTGTVWTGSEPAGSTAYDTSVVSEQGGIAPTGTVTYSLFANKGCTGTASTTGSVTLAGGAVPNSSTTAALTAGSYSFKSKYSGDSNYSASSSGCETLSVA